MKLIQLNIERDTHLDLIIPFLEHEQPDIVCLQEVFEYDLELLGEILSMQKAYAPMFIHPRSVGSTEYAVGGVGILSRMPIQEVQVRWYFGDGKNIPIHNEHERDTVHQPLLSCLLDIGGVQVNVSTTHFMKSWDGAPDDYQRERMKRFLPVLEDARPDILCGDFNIPRGTELYTVLCKQFKDNVPFEYVSSIDSKLHRMPGLSFMIDYMWSSSRVQCTNVQMKSGISDHCALMGEVSFGQ